MQAPNYFYFILFFFFFLFSETKKILKNVTGSFKKGELTAVLGPSGIFETKKF